MKNDPKTYHYKTAASSSTPATIKDTPRSESTRPPPNDKNHPFSTTCNKNICALDDADFSGSCTEHSVLPSGERTLSSGKNNPLSITGDSAVKSADELILTSLEDVKKSLTTSRNLRDNTSVFPIITAKSGGSVVHVLLDNCNQSTLISRSLIKRLQLEVSSGH